MTRVVYLHQYFKTREGRGGTRSYEFAKRLAAAGYDVHVVTSDQASEPAFRGWRVEAIDGFTVHWLSAPYSNTMSFRRRIGAFLRFAALASFRARALRGDLIFATSTPLTIAIPGMLAKLGRRVPMVFEVRDLWPELPIAMGALKNPLAKLAARMLERSAYKSSAEVIALSPGMADGVVAAGYPRGRVSVIPNACDLDLFDVDEGAVDSWLARHPHLQGRPLVVYAGTFGHINGVGYLVDVARHVQKLNPEIAFVLIGAGAEFDSVRSRAAADGVLDRNVFISGPVPKREIPLLLGAATIATSLFIPVKEMEANSANKFFDALAAGRPVAINYSGWQRELLEQSGAGVWLDPRDSRNAALAIHRAIVDADGLRAMAGNSRTVARTHFSRDVLAGELADVLGRAIDGSVRMKR